MPKETQAAAGRVWLLALGEESRMDYQDGQPGWIKMHSGFSEAHIWI